jgi:tetratricopeptide (TPR) repeat protein
MVTHYQAGNYRDLTENRVKERLLVERSRALAILALAAHARGDGAAATTLASEAVALRAGSSDALFTAGFIAAANGAPTQSVRFLKDALWFNRYGLFSRELTWSVLGASYAALDNTEEASRALAQAGPQAPGAAASGAIFTVAQAEIRKGNFPKAIDLLRSLVAAKPEHIGARVTLARLLTSTANRALQKERIVEAEAIITQVLLDPKTTDPLRREAYEVGVRAAAKLDKIDVAKQLLKDATEAFPGDPQLLALRDQLRVESEAVASRAELSKKPEAVPST